METKVEVSVVEAGGRRAENKAAREVYGVREAGGLHRGGGRITLGLAMCANVDDKRALHMNTQLMAIC